MLNTPDVYDDLSKYLAKKESSNIKTCHGFIKIAERISWLRKYFTQNKNVTTTAMLKFLVQRFDDLLLVLNPACYDEGLKEDKTREARILLKDKILQGNITPFYENNSKNYQKDLPLSF